MGNANSGRRVSWQTPGAPLEVACWCGESMRRFSRRQVFTGDCGWSCGKWLCTRERQA